MRTDTPKTIYLKDYKPYPYEVASLNLNFDLRDGHTDVTTVTIFKSRTGKPEPLFLNGEALEILSVKLDGQSLEAGRDFEVSDTGMTLTPPAKPEFTMEIVTRIHPETNTRLEGLYQSGGNYCTQCEAEGFRRITYYPDRPDVMTVFTTRIEADKGTYPVLLGNGNLTQSGNADNGRHFTIWHDPFPKPCYLFALVAGNLNHIHDTFTTRSGRKVDLYIYVRPGDEGQCDHAMESLKKSMKWDEDVYGLEYDLDLFNIVAVSDFNMGAMENKSLNIFNTALVLAHPDTATDGDFIRVESVIAHEYFHNWSGNRVTCRDWFQLSLKEGLTVFRDQEFSADIHSRDVQRIDDVAHLRRLQFPEDAGPLAHPIRPDNYIEINNFYTMTVYEKGAEVIRMMRTILGAENYRKGTDLYFSRHDGQAATCEDFVTCMEDATGADLKQFRLWYEQAGTPELTFSGSYDPQTRQYTVTLSQNTPATPGQPVKKPVHIPVEIGLLGRNGVEIASSRLLHLKEESQSFTFDDIPGKPIPSVLRKFSAPVKLHSNLDEDDLAFLMAHDTDGFNRWEAGQTLAVRTICRDLDGRGQNEVFIASFGKVLDYALSRDADKALAARLIALPDIGFIGQHRKPVDPPAIHDARESLLSALREKYGPILEHLYEKNKTEGPVSMSPGAMGVRALANGALALIDDLTRAGIHYRQAQTMTDRVAALSVMATKGGKERDAAFADFYERFKSYALVVDKWFALQASATRPDIISHLGKLRNHGDFNIKNPNRARSLFAAFAMNNPASFHAQNGSGYSFLADAVVELNSINPQIAARLLTPMRDWKNYTPDRQEKMQAALARILETPDLSPDVFEIASKSLKA